MWRPILYLILMYSLLPSSRLCAEAVSLQFGYMQGDFTPDRHEYVRGLQSQIFDNKKLEAYPVALNYYHLYRDNPDSFRELWIFGLGLNQASITDSYSGGSLKLERRSYFYHIGYRLENSRWIAPFRTSIEFSYLNGISGQVQLKSPNGSRSYREDFDLITLNSWRGSVAAEYNIFPDYFLSLTLQLYTRASLGLLMGVHYEWQN